MNRNSVYFLLHPKMNYVLDLSIPKSEKRFVYTVTRLPENYVRDPNAFYGYNHPRDNSPADRMRSFNEGKPLTLKRKRED